MVVATWLFPRWIPALYPIPSINSALNLVLFTVTIFTIVAYFIRQRDHFQRASDALLRNVLPAVIVERLKQPTPTVVDHVPEASVLFADVVNFTPLAAQLTPDELVQLLNAVFSAFDQLVAHHGLEKIKTIGDCYMVAAGVPTPRPDHAVALVQLALAMQALLATERFHGQQLCFRMGINSGPLVARVIGTHKFLYDLWGDTVNTASRMESHGTGGHIQITATTYALIHDQFICDAQGTITVKGKGELPVWYVRAVRTAANGGHGSTPA
jgi:adenylate cyclase